MEIQNSANMPQVYIYPRADYFTSSAADTVTNQGRIIAIKRLRRSRASHPDFFQGSSQTPANKIIHRASRPPTRQLQQRSTSEHLIVVLAKAARSVIFGRAACGNWSKVFASATAEICIH
jgi:hypothetical protein